MSSLLGGNGRPLIETVGPSILKPGQQEINLRPLIQPSGVVLVVEINGRTTPIDLGGGGAGKLGMALIGLEAQHALLCQQHAAREPEIEFKPGADG